MVTKGIYIDIDSLYVKGKREFIGVTQPKFWYYSMKNPNDMILVKRQSFLSTKKNVPKSPTFNHFGEYMGYKIAEQIDIKACPVDLGTLYDTKNRYSKTMIFYTVCASHKLIEIGAVFSFGENIICEFLNTDTIESHTVLKKIDSLYHSNSYIPSDLENNVDVIIAALSWKTRKYEHNMGKRTEDEIEQDVRDNVRTIIYMILYDCIFGNYDRHSQNWAVQMSKESGKLTVYPLYDNEAVFGLNRPVSEINEIILDTKDMQKKIDSILCSRMGIKGANSKVSYDKMISYLIDEYPDYTIPALKSIISKIDNRFVESIYDSFKGISTRGEHAEELTEKDELPDIYRIFGLYVFNQRINSIRGILDKSKQVKKEKLERQM